MCFSATASFAAGTSLCVVGGVTLTRARGKGELALALVPLMFGVQQLSEGVVWLGITHNWHAARTVASYAYLSFSHVIWPMFVPFAVLGVETVRHQRRMLRVLQVVGLLTGAYLLYFLIRDPVDAHAEGRSVIYETPLLHLAMVMVAYMLATCGACIASTHRAVRVFGIAAFGLAIAAYIVSVTTFVSVWCFFAAVLSLLIYAYFGGPRREEWPELAAELGLQ